MNSAIVGILAALVIGVTAVKSTTGDYLRYVDFVGILIVVGGTVSASAISYNISDLTKMFWKVCQVVFRADAKPQAIAQSLVEIAKMGSSSTITTQSASRVAAIHPFIGDGVRYIENGLSAEEIHGVMNVALIERNEDQQREIEIISNITKYPPVFGMIGTVTGLIALMYGLGDAKASKSIGPNMALALTTTLYGLTISNYILQPLVDRLNNRLTKEMQVRRMIIQGIFMIARGDDPVLVHETLNAYLLPHRRMKLAPQRDDRPSRRAG